MQRRAAALALIALALAGCRGGEDEQNASAPVITNAAAPPSVNQPGVTPMAQRVAVIGILNKRNGITQSVALRPGQSVRWKDVIEAMEGALNTLEDISDVVESIVLKHA